MNQDERPIRVDFPKKMEVTSPEIDSIKESTKTIANIFHKDFKAIVISIQSLTELPKLFREVKELLVNQFQNLFTSQVEGDIMSRQANIQVLNKKVSFVEKHILKKQGHAKDTASKITGRYEGVSSQMAKEHEHFLKRLDSHAYDIVENIYPQQIQEKFSYDSQAGINFLTAHANESAYTRSICLNESFNEAKNSVEKFLEERNIFYSSLAELADEKLETGEFNLPVIALEKENRETGELMHEFIFPWEISNEKPPLHETIKNLEEISEKTFEKNQPQEFEVEIKTKLTHEIESELLPSELSCFRQECQIYI